MQMSWVMTCTEFKGVRKAIEDGDIKLIVPQLIAICEKYAKKEWDFAENYEDMAEELREVDVDELEEVLYKNLGTKEDYEKEYGKVPLGELVRSIVGLDMSAAKEAFSVYLNDVNLDDRQIYFLNQIIEYIVHNGLMKDLSVPQESPFTDRGSVVEIFTDLTLWQGIREVIETINRNAAA